MISISLEVIIIKLKEQFVLNFFVICNSVHTTLKLFIYYSKQSIVYEKVRTILPGALFGRGGLSDQKIEVKPIDS